MFGEYAQIASYLSQRDSYGRGSSYDDDPLPAYLRPPPFHSSLSWESGRDRSVLKEDFIMIAEFSELEGPKPVMTIPKDGGRTFDQNSFSVRILATDHQTQNEGFSISEDAQVVLSDYDTGVVAFVHHFVLYDNTARGFVRPYCIAFITADQRKLMRCYEDISSHMKKVAKLFKYGNRLLFAGDLERHLKNLDHTKDVLLARVSNMRLRDSDQRGTTAQETRQNAENELHRALQSIHQSTSEIKDILTVLRPLLCEKRLEERFRFLEQRAFRDASSAALDKLSLQDNWFNDLSSLPSLDVKCGSCTESREPSPLSLFRPRDHKPLLVETKKAKRFNAPLRGLHELCSWGAKEGLKKLRDVQEYFKRDMVTIEVENAESKLFHPGSTGIFCGHCVTGNFLNGVRKPPSRMDSVENSSFYGADWASSISLDSLNSYKSAEDTSLTYFRTSNASPCSFQTVDSQNDHFYSSFSNNEISLGEENEYYPFSSDHSCFPLSYTASESEKDGNTLCDSSPTEQIQAMATAMVGRETEETKVEKEKVKLNQLQETEETKVEKEIAKLNQLQETEETKVEKEIAKLNQLQEPEESKMENEMANLKPKQEVEEPKVENDTAKLNQFHSAASFNDEDGPPLVIFQEKIERPLSVISLGCQDETDMELKDTEKCTESVLEGSQATAFLNEVKEGVPVPFEETSRDIYINKEAISNSTKQSQIVDDINSILFMSFVKDSQSQSQNIFTVSQSQNIFTTSQSNNLLSLAKNNNIGDISPPQNDTESTSHKTCDITTIKCQNGEKVTSSYPVRDLMWDQTDHLKSMGTVHNITSEESTNSSKTGKVFEEDISILMSPPVSSSLQSNPPAFHSMKTYPSFPPKGIHITSPQKMVQKSDNQFHQTSEHISLQDSLECDNNKQLRSFSETSSSFTELSLKDFTSISENGSQQPQQQQPELQSQPSILEDETDGPDDYMQPATGIWCPRHGLFTLGDWLNNLACGKPGSGLLDIINSYSNLQHIIYSLLTGRPVLVVGTAKMEPEVIKLVNALAAFVPSTKRKRHSVIEWTSKPLRMLDLTKLRLVGICRSERRKLDSCVPFAIKRASSILDVDRKMISAPHYQGQLINSVLSKKKCFKTESLLLAHIQWWLMDIMAKAFIFFHSFCMGSAGSIFFSHGLREHRDAYTKNVTGIMGKLGIRDNDCSIVEYMAELAKLSFLEASQQAGLDSGNLVQPFQLRHTVCQTFRC